MSGTSDPKARHRLVPRRSLRTQLIMPIVAPAIALTGLWGYTAAGLAGEQIQLQDDAERTATTGGRTLNVVTALQQERRLTALWQTSRSAAARSALDQARTKTDAAVVEFRAGLSSTDGSLGAAAGRLGTSLDTLTGRREAIDTRTMSSAEAFGHLTDVIQSGTDLIGAAVRSEDGPLAQGGNATATLVRLVEMLSREDALLTAGLPQGSISAADHQRFGQSVAAQREIRASLAGDQLPADARTRYAQIVAGPQATSVASVEDAVIAAPAAQLPSSTKAWSDDAETLVTDLQKVTAASLDELADAASDRATGLLIGLIAGTTLTAALLTAGAVLGLRARRSTLDAVAELQRRTEEMARQWPQAVAQSERGEPLAPVVPTSPLLASGELQLLGSAIEGLRHTAIDTLLSQSRGHAGAEKVLGQLTRRTQTLIHRLIALLDDLERKHGDSDLLKDIFKVDHLATRVRRHAENLVILGDTPPSRRMTEPVTITDVMRSAVAETEHYTRVKVENLPATKRIALAGRAVADVTHLLAELVENATNFSPPYTQVVVSALHVADGVALHVEDHGLGIPADQLAHANHILAHPQKPDMAALGADPRLGHFVVSRLAQRHRIRVELRPSVYGGTLAIVFLPVHMLEELGSPVMDQLRAAAQVSVNAIDPGTVPQPGDAPSFGSATSALPGPTPLTRPSDGPPGLVGVPGGRDEHDLAADARDIGGAPVAPPQETHSRVPDYSGFPTYGGAGLVSPHHQDGAESLDTRQRPVSPEPPRAAPVPRQAPAAGPPAGGPVPPMPTGRPLPDAPVPPMPAGRPMANAPAPSAPTGRPMADASLPPAPRAAESPYGTPGAENPYGMPGGGESPFGTPGGESPYGTPGGDRPNLGQPATLPQRTRGSSLAVQLRREAAEAGSRLENEGAGPTSPEASARIIAAIRRGMDQATGTHSAPPHDGGRAY
ncbi:nitrate- and nitrite sensing domain-containing protein [Streptomyces sp. NPDC056460]|uniref:sensor histidine kinase n=1 Tax=Streptomyces sp. NPDC056460 TaxID=3345825 RepID=UPI0036B281FE